MAGGNGKKGDVIILHPEKTIIDKINDSLEDTSLTNKMIDTITALPSKPIRFMGTFDEDPYIATLAAQYKAFMDRRSIRIKGTELQYRELLTFEDYLEVRGEI